VVHRAQKLSGHQAAVTDDRRRRKSILEVLTKACSRLLNAAVTAVGRTFGSSPNKLASSAAASPRMRITMGSCNHVRLAAKSAMSSPFPSVEDITVRCIARDERV
jgi:hypothetical protein